MLMINTGVINIVATVIIKKASFIAIKRTLTLQCHVRYRRTNFVTVTYDICPSCIRSSYKHKRDTEKESEPRPSVREMFSLRSSRASMAHEYGMTLISLGFIFIRSRKRKAHKVREFREQETRQDNIHSKQN